MSLAEYTYAFSDFPNGKVDTDRLYQEIVGSTITIALSQIQTIGTACKLYFKAVLPDNDVAVLDGLVANHSGEPLPVEKPKVELENVSFDGEKRIRVSPEPRKEGSGLVIVTHNWCDPTTWYTQSVRVTDEVLSNSGDNKTFTSAHNNWIDLTHGKVYRENLIAALYLPLIKVNGVTKTPRAPWATSGGDYSINYAAGTVTFFEAVTGQVTASYSYATGSMFIIAPMPGKRLWIEYSEVQFSEDIDIRSTVHFQPWATNPQNPQYKIPVAAPTTYKTLDNYIEEANGCYPPVPPMGGGRGFTKARYTFPFRYQTIKELRSSQGAEIRIWLENDVPYGGEYSTATFYCTVYNE